MKTIWKKFEEDSKQFNTNTSIGTFEYSLNISLKYNYLYTETPKVACSSIKTILQKLELNNHTLHHVGFDDIHDREYSPLLRPSQVRPLNDFLKGDRLYKFCFSRNPYTRTLSCYIDKIKNNKPEKRIILKELGMDIDKLDTEISFSEFIDVITEQRVIDMNPHWRTQYYQTYQDRISYDFIGKLENLEEDLKKVLNRITPDYSKFLSKETRHATNATDLISQYYTDSLVRKVQSKFAVDFDYFKYSLDVNVVE